ncbi:MAG: hypothetical protein PWR01_3768 [Clostridiales bacterium]|jgi:hypothetical protein|nr:hypothetical protein [Clostridiales bacterium]MDN5282695.1 hypothetical protein [Candidatus Ozemobacter sp.]
MGMWTIPKGPEKDLRFTSEELDEFIDKVATAVARRGMSVPAIMALEMSKPLSFIGYSSLVIFGPILELVIDPVKMEKLQAVVADRERIEQLIVAIENLEKHEKDSKEGESREQK